eukprot:1159778-Pelagomonas_calceolata.AAC.22
MRSSPHLPSSGVIYFLSEVSLPAESSRRAVVNARTSRMLWRQMQNRDTTRIKKRGQSKTMVSSMQTTLPFDSSPSLSGTLV